jgi:hypothetical protein
VGINTVYFMQRASFFLGVLGPHVTRPKISSVSGVGFTILVKLAYLFLWTLKKIYGT